MKGIRFAAFASVLAANRRIEIVEE